MKFATLARNRMSGAAQIMLRSLAWVLVILAPVSIVLAVRAGQPFKDAILPFGVLIAFAGLLFGPAHDLGEAMQKMSLFYLESSVKAYEGAQALLKDGNNDRATWIAAGRALVHAKDLADNVTLDAHRKVLELTRLGQRRFFGSLIQANPAAFFYGTDNETGSLEDAAKRSSEGDKDTISRVRELSEKSIRAVWEAAQWPQECSDPLGRIFSDDEVNSLIVLYPRVAQLPPAQANV
jgi:hypothetical protein